MAGRGSVTNHGVGRRITTDAGSTTTTRGPGCRAATSTRSEAGGGPHSSLSSGSVFHLATTFAGTHCRITSAIRIHVITVAIIQTTAAAAATGTMIAMGGMRVTGEMVDAMIDVMVMDATTGAG